MDVLLTALVVILVLMFGTRTLSEVAGVRYKGLITFMGTTPPFSLDLAQKLLRF